MTNYHNPLQRYKIRKKIGTGGMASVFLAEDTVLGRPVALKMVHPHLLQQPETLRRFSNEAQAIASLSHEHIIRIHDYGECRSRPFIVMEYVDGCTLEELIGRGDIIPSLTAIELALQILSGLLCAHEKGIYHRDIKPANIIIDSGGSLRITDFGIAYLVNAESMTLTGSFLGSPFYISPEQVSNRPVTGTTDIFSLGIVLYQCCTGTVPFMADTPHGIIHAICTEELTGPITRNRRLLYGLADCIERFLDKDPATRPDAKTAIDMLEQLCRKIGVTTDNGRLAAYVKDSSSAQIREEEELFDALLRMARLAVTQHHFAEGMRLFKQASCFGILSDADTKLVRRVTRRSARLRALAIGIGVLATGSALLLLVVFLIGTSARKEESIIEVVDSLQTDTVSFPDTTSIKNVSEKSVVKVQRDKKKPAVVAPITVTPTTMSPKRDENEVSDSATGSSVDTVTDSSENPGFLFCMTNPPWVTVYVDGFQRGETPFRTPLPLAGGRHEIRFVKQTFGERVESVDIHRGETTFVRIRLNSSEKE